MARRGEYRLVLSADGKLLRQEVKKSEEDLKGFQGAVKNVSAELNKMGATAVQDLSGKLGKVGELLAAIGPGGLAAAAGIGALAGAMTAIGAAVASAVAKVAEIGGHFKDMADRSGISAEALQEFGFAAKLTGTSTEAFVGALRVMQVNLVNNEEKFRRLGLSVTELKNLKPEDQFTRVADAIKGIEDPAKQSAAAIEVFGRQGVTLLPAIKEGLGGITAEAEELAVALSDKSVNAADAFGDATTKLSAAWEGLQNQLASVITDTPAITETIEEMARAIGALAKAVKDNKNDILAFFNVMFGAQIQGAKTIAARMNEAAQDVGSAADVLHGRGPKIKTSTGPSGIPEDPFTAMQERAMIEAGKSIEKELAAAKKVAAEKEAAAKRAAEAFARASERAREAWDKFYDDMEGRGRKAIHGLSGDIDKAVDRMAQQNADRAMRMLEAREEERVSTIQGLEDEAQAVADLYMEMQEEADEAFAAMREGIDSVAFGFQDLGDVIGGTLGKVLGFVGQTIGGIGRIMDHIKSFKAAGGGLTGFLGKAGSVLGIAGTAIGIGKSIIGGIRGLFGGKSDEQKAQEEAERRQAKEKALSDLAAIEERIKKFRMDSLQQAVGGTAALFQNLANTAGVSQERMDRLGRLGAATFAQLKKEGMSTVEAMNAMGPALDAAIAAAGKAGLELPAAMAEFAAFRDLVNQNQELVNAAEGIGQLITGLKATGGLTQAAMNDAMAEVGDLFDQLQAAGFTSQQALAAMAPSLFAIQQAAKDGKVAIDAETQALIDQAEAAGLFENMKDPMAEMVEIQKLMLETTAALAKVFGAVLPAEVQKYIDKLHQVPGIPGVPGAPSGSGGGGDGVPSGPAKGAPQDYTTAAKGMRFQKLKRDTVIQAHKGEHVMIVPEGEPVSFKSAASGMSGTAFPGAGIPSGDTTVGGAITVAPVVNMPIDPLAIDRNFEQFLQRIERSIAEGIRAGSSPVLRSLQDRGKVV